MKSITTRLDQLLGPIGFVRHKESWNRRSGFFTDVIDIQTSKAGDTMTINAGVLHPEVHRKCWGAEPATVIEEPSCTVRARIGKLIDDHDLWWRLDDARLINDVVDKLKAYVLPFLDRMHSLEAMEEFLTTSQVMTGKYPLPVIQLAILKGERGDGTGACALLAELSEKAVGAWGIRIKEVAERLGCSSMMG